MFYSQCLISRKGLLKPIWVAAYCHQKLKKHQVAETDISSSVDEIMLNEVTVTYRVLGYLLLGVVRIYSKKVEYLYHDCNDILTKINTYAPLKKPKEAMCAPYASITLPETFELDGFDLELPEDMSDWNTATRQQITLDERSEDAGDAHNFFDKYYHEVDLARFDTTCAVHTPVRDALSPHSMDNYMDVYPPEVLTSSEARMEKFQGNQFPREEYSDFGISCGAEEPVECGNPPDVLITSEATMEKFRGNQLLREEFSDFGESCGAEEPMEHGTHFDEVDSQDKRINFLEITPPDPGKSGVLNEGNPLANTADGIHTAATPEFMIIRTPSKKEQPRFSRKRKLLFDESIVLSNKVMRQSLLDSSNLVIKRRKCPVTVLDVWKACRLPNFHQDFLEPLIPCAPKLKTLFYRESVGTPQPLEASAGLFKSGEDRYETNREPSEERTYSLEASIGLFRSGEDRHETHREPSEERAYSVETSEGPSRSGEDRHQTHSKPSERRANSEKNTMDDSRWSCFEAPTTSKSDMVVPMTSVSRGEDDLSDGEVEDIGLNLTDEELRPCGEDNNEEQNGWSVRTRKVANFLCKIFLKQKKCGRVDGLNLKPIIDGRTRKESARLFYEVLFLKSRGFVDVKQDSPYSDICLLSTPQLMTTV